MLNSIPVFISVVSPVYCADQLVASLARRICASLSLITENFEVILVDDRSPDSSWAEIQAEIALESRIKGVRLSRNFGQHNAITAGLAQCQGEWIVVMDCDLQDRPEEIPALLSCAIGAGTVAGYDMVLARRVERQDTLLKKQFSRLFYKTLSYLTDTPQDPSIANFGIFHRKVIAAVLAMPESIRYFPTMVRWVGFNRGTLDVEHAERQLGGSSYNIKRLLNLALDIILAYSDKPLRLTVKLGLSVSFAAFCASMIYLVRFLRGDILVLGYTSLILSVWFFSGLILSVLGVVGLYLGRTFEQVKNRPLYIIDELVTNLDTNFHASRI